MAAEWYYLIDGEQVGPVETFRLRELVDSGFLKPTDFVWREGMADWKPASQVQTLFSPASPRAPVVVGDEDFLDEADEREYRQFVNNKIAAGLCGIFFGHLGVHKFILGLTTPGIIVLSITLLTCGMGIIVTGPIGLIEGIIYLTKSDEDFYEEYAIEKRGWF